MFEPRCVQVWVAFLSFLSEILIGPQGLLSILQKQGWTSA